MIFTFRSKATGELIMLGEHAKPLLKVAGKSDETLQQPRGVFTPEQLAPAIAGITRAVRGDQDPDFNEDDPVQAAQARQYVSLKQRAQPLLDMLAKAEAKQVEVMWEIGGR
ncbi:DUF1840 domain-containing protein [Achromobacter sp. GG226]|uniref:DUF1840 domain-containing protein n=1 Tax=Verticiella alkaliphila TaxID=2779529 RepID=UPI001C0E7327|nr:DUF1840 domain-containing protein [Verticiella sp. GG226]MBU4612511.1 DUF1840 domain-containing protein [Verticiella sp. GG226]